MVDTKATISKEGYDCPIIDGNLMSKALTYTSYSNLSLREIPIPTDIRPGEILVRVKAVALNPIDVLMHKMSLSFLGSRTKLFAGDYAGVVVKAGEDSGFDDGDSVYGYRLPVFSMNGTFSQYIVIDPKKVILCDRIPKGMLYEQAASLACTAATGYGAIKYALTKGDAKSGDTLAGALKGKKIFITGAGTSVGSYAVEIAKRFMKADKIVVTCSSRSEKRIKELGADLAIDYRDGDLKNVNSVLEYVKENGKFDIIVDCVRNEVYMDVLDLILKDPNEDGAFCQIFGSKSMKLDNPSLLDVVLPSYRSVKYWFLYQTGYFKYPIYTFKLGYDATFADVVEQMWADKTLETPIDSIFLGWTQYDLAIARITTGRVSGKVVCML